MGHHASREHPDEGVEKDPSQQQSSSAPLKKHSTGDNFLNDEQRKLILRTWSDDFETLYTLGARIYTEIFDRAPEAQHLFPATKYGEHWQESREFRNLALRLVQVINQTVRFLNSVEAYMNPMLRDL